MASVGREDSLSSEENELHVRLFIYELIVKNICMMLPNQHIDGPFMLVDADNEVSLSFWLNSKRSRTYGVGGYLKTTSRPLSAILDEIFIRLFFVDQKKCILNDGIILMGKSEDLHRNSLKFETEGDFGRYFRDACCNMRFEVTIVSRKSLKQEDDFLFYRSVNTLADDLTNLLLRGKTFANVIVKIGDETYFLHEFILYQRWPYLDKLSVDFDRMVFADYEGVPCGITQPHPKIAFIRKGSMTIIKIDDSLGDIFAAFLHYLYSKRIVSLEIPKYFKLYWAAKELELDDLRAILLPSLRTFVCEIIYGVSSCTFAIRNFSSCENGETIGVCILKSNVQSEITWKIMLIRLTDSQSIQVRLQKLSNSDFNVLVGLKVLATVPNSKTYCFGTTYRIFKSVSSIENDHTEDLFLQCPILGHHIFEDTIHITCCLFASCGQNNSKTEDLLSDIEGRFEGKNLSKCMTDLYVNGSLSDLTIKINNFTANVHKALLYVRWPGFVERILKGSHACGRIIRADQRSVRRKAVELIFLFIYTGKIENLNMDNAKMLYKASKFYKVPELSDICTTYMIQNMDYENARSIYELAEKERDFYLQYHVREFLGSKALLGETMCHSEN